MTSVWISSDGNYAFIEFRTPEEANEGFVLNDLMILGKPLKVGRPHTYPNTGGLGGMFSQMANPNLTRLLQPGNWASSGAAPAMSSACPSASPPASWMPSRTAWWMAGTC